jgi:GntR family transcriptional regulator
MDFSIDFSIDLASPLPLYAQIKEQIKFALASGRIKKGNKLPSVREVSKELRINPNTVVQAYKELEYENILFTKKGQGTFISMNAPEITEKDRVKILSKQMEQVVAKAKKIGSNRKELTLILVQSADKLDFDKKEDSNG